MLEFEKKVLLTPEEYRELLALANGNTARIVQTNYYYDSDQLDMNRQGITCRIREKNGRYKATVKNHRAEDRECSVENAKEVLGPLDDSFFKGMNVNLQGYLTTTRTVFYAGKGLEVVLDENTYLGTQDFELEIEYTCENANHADFVLRLLAMILHGPDKGGGAVDFCVRTRFSQSKSERFFERMQFFRQQAQASLERETDI